MHELIPGIEFDFGGGTKKVVPPLSLGALQRLQGKLGELANSTNPLESAAVETVIEAAFAALKRNYPDVRKEDVADLIDVGNMHEVISCVLDVAGLKRKQIAEDAKNALALPAGTLQPIGQGSSPESAQTPVGPGPTSESTSTSQQSTP